MSIFKDPPVFDSVNKPYNRYMEELKAWCIVTDVAKNKQGVAVALSLPENDPTQIREKIFTDIPLVNLNKADGVNAIIHYMSSLMKKDEVCELFQGYILFSHYQRQPNQEIHEFILQFEALYNKIKANEMILPQRVLAFKLLDAAKLSFHERKLVLTGVSYCQKEALFNQMKKALEKYYNKQAEQKSTKKKFLRDFKLLPSFITNRKSVSNDKDQIKSLPVSKTEKENSRSYWAYKNVSVGENINKRVKKHVRFFGKTKIEAPIGNVTFAHLTIKNVATFWETLDEDSALKALEDIHDLVARELKTYHVYTAKEEIGKFLLATQNLEDMLNLAMKVQLNFNENKWSEGIMRIPGFKKLVRPEDQKKTDSTPLFSGPRVQIGIHSGEASNKKDASGHTTYSGINVLKTESIGNFTQPGQILLSDSTWKNVDTSKLDPHCVTEPGVYKLDGFSSGCKVVEVLPSSLKDRSKFFGSVCAHCNDVIKPNEQFFRALNCIWHMNHFRCFECNADLGGSYVELEGSPYCKNCYLAKNAPKCKNCSNPITGGYINALGGYWHADCFACKRCLKKPSPQVQIYENDGLPYCGDCYKQIMA